MKRITTLLLVILSVFLLASCKSAATQKQPQKVALEHVYLTEKFPMPDEDDDIYVYDMYISGENFFFRGSKDETFTNENGEEEYRYTDLVYITDKTFSDYREFFSFEGENYWNEDTYESKSTYFSNVFPDGQGGIWVSISSYHSYPLDDSFNEWENENNTILYHYDADGNVISELDCSTLTSKIPDPDSMEVDNFYVNNVLSKADGSIYIVSNNRVISASAEGEYINSKHLGDNKNISSAALLPNGDLRVISYDWSSDEGETEIIDYSSKSNSFKKTCTLSVSDNSFLDSKGNVYTDDTYVLSKVDPSSGNKTPLLDWINSDINCDRIFQTTVQDGEIYTFEWDNDYETRSLLHLTPAGEGDVVEKFIITLAANTISSNLKNMIIDYNRSSSEYRIQVKAYGWEEGASDKFDMDLLAGNVPDIVCLDSLNAEKYTSKGLFADLGEMLDNDKEISRDDFLPNVLKASEINGTLYRLPVSFSVRSLVGKSSVLGDKKSWTWNDFADVMKKYPDAEMLSELDRKTAMETILPLIIDDFIDYNNGSCNFTDGNFGKFLDYVKTLPVEIDWDTFYENIDWEEYDSRYKNNKALLMVSYISDLAGNSYEAESFGEPVNYIGFPTTGENGHAIHLSSQFAIGASSAYKEQAWDFLKMVFEEEYQMEYIWDFPVTKAAFDKKKEEAIRDVEGMNDEKDYPVWDDYAEVMPAVELTEEAVEEVIVEDALVEDAETVIDSDMVVKPAPMPGYGGEEDLETRKARMLDTIERNCEIAKSASSLIRNNDPMIEVITSEAAAYLDGKKSLDETCKIIESRVSLYLAENM